MSINSLANAAAARRPDTIPLGSVPQNLDDIAKASSTNRCTVNLFYPTNHLPERVC